MLLGYIWADRGGTDEELLRHWCRHYRDRGVENAQLCLNVSGKVDDSKFFKALLKAEYPQAQVSVDTRPFHNRNKTDFQNSFVTKGSGYFIPADADEFVELDVDDCVRRLSLSGYPALRGRLLDRLALADGSPDLKRTDPDIPPAEQFPMEMCLACQVGRAVCKVALVRAGEALTTGHHYHKGFRTRPPHPGPPITVSHYCWTATSLYNRSERRNAKINKMYARITAILRGDLSHVSITPKEPPDNDPK